MLPRCGYGYRRCLKSKLDVFQRDVTDSFGDRGVRNICGIKGPTNAKGQDGTDCEAGAEAPQGVFLQPVDARSAASARCIGGDPERDVAEELGTVQLRTDIRT